jgi:hypothetical protein
VNQDTAFEELNAPPVVPEGFPMWATVLDTWGSKMIAALRVSTRTRVCVSVCSCVSEREKVKIERERTTSCCVPAR